MKRRDFLKVLGFTGAGMGVSCLETYHWMATKPGKLTSYIDHDAAVPGESSYYPGTCTECPANCGLLIKVRDGRAIKLEGNAGHPINDGRLCIRGQASLARLYHPERIGFPSMRGAEDKLVRTGWDKVYSRIIEALTGTPEGQKHVYLAGRTTGSLSRLIEAFCDKMGVTRAMEFETYPHAALREGYRKVLGIYDIPFYAIEKSDFLLTLGADILETFVSPVSYSVQFGRAAADHDWKWFHVEPHLSLTGLKADRRFTLSPRSEMHLLKFLLSRLPDAAKRRLPETLLAQVGAISAAEAARHTGISPRDLDLIEGHLSQAKRPLLITGGASLAHSSGLEAAVLSALIQWATGMVGEVVDFARSENYTSVGTRNDIATLGKELEDGRVGVVFFSRTDPVGQANLGEHLPKAKLRVGLGDIMDGTLAQCDVVLPLSHFAEILGDASPRSDVASIIQPAVKPILDTRGEGDILLDLMRLLPDRAGQVPDSFEEYLYDRWAEVENKGGMEVSLKDSFFKTGFYRIPPSPREIGLHADEVAGFFEREARLDAPEVRAEELLVLPSLRTFDGRSSHIPLLQEIPDPLTTISYGRWASISSGTAGKLRIGDGDVVEMTAGDYRGKLPVKVQPLLSDRLVTVHRERQSKLPVDPRCGEEIAFAAVALARAGERERLPILSGSMSQQGRGIIAHPVVHHVHATFYPDPEHIDYRWAMVIDLGLCSGCSACVAACYIENNVALAGRDEHLRGREMSWIRMEPYLRETGDGVTIIPMLCQQCSMAPCETVCPVFAAEHNSEGLNVQVYSRCVGTRYCSNNCPYKVRRFNWFDHEENMPLKDAINPDVVMRTKGVMEKCTFCIQRIRDAKDKAKDQARKVRDGEIVPACAQTCPTGAITFGNMLDTQSRVYNLAHSGRAYRVYESLGIDPSVYYLREGDHR